MITELAQSLYELVTDLNTAIEYNISAMTIQEKGINLNSQLKEYEQYPKILFKEIFEDWCKIDVLRFYWLVNSLLNKKEEWCEKSTMLLADLPMMIPILCEIADEIEQRRPEIIADLTPTPHPDTSPPVITDLVIDTSTGATAPEDWRLPSELDTDRARKYFKRCIDEGWLTITSTGGVWKLQAVRLGYVCNRIFEQPRPLTALIKFFNNPNLKAQITQAGYEAKTAKLKKWRAEIDSKIFFD